MIKIIFLFALCALVSSYAPPQDDESFYLPGSEIVNEELRNIILHEHNKFRSNFNVEAPLSWDYRLELFSQLRARELRLGAASKKFDHRKYPAPEWVPYGENLAMSLGSSLSIAGLTEAAIFAWRNETSWAMDMNDVLTELETTASEARKAEVYATLETKAAAKETRAEVGHAWIMVRPDMNFVGCSYTIGTGNVMKWDFVLVCQYSWDPVPQIPTIAWNAPLFDLVTDANASAHRASRISVTRALKDDPNAYVPKVRWQRKKEAETSPDYSTIGARNLLETSAFVSARGTLEAEEKKEDEAYETVADLDAEPNRVSRSPQESDYRPLAAPLQVPEHTAAPNMSENRHGASGPEGPVPEPINPVIEPRMSHVETAETSVPDQGATEHKHILPTNLQREHVPSTDPEQGTSHVTDSSTPENRTTQPNTEEPTSEPMTQGVASRRAHIEADRSSVPVQGTTELKPTLPTTLENDHAPLTAPGQGTTHTTVSSTPENRTTQHNAEEPTPEPIAPMVASRIARVETMQLSATEHKPFLPMNLEKEHIPPADPEQGTAHAAVSSTPEDGHGESSTEGPMAPVVASRMDHVDADRSRVPVPLHVATEPQPFSSMRSQKDHVRPREPFFVNPVVNPYCFSSDKLVRKACNAHSDTFCIQYHIE